MVDPQILSKVYMAAGVILPLFYIQQVRVCLRDQTKLHAFSLSKATTQLFLRMAMIPFLLTVDSHEILYIALIDFAARLAEVFAAVYSLRRQGDSFGSILTRCNPFAHGAATAAQPKWDEPVFMQARNQEPVFSPAAADHELAEFVLESPLSKPELVSASPLSKPEEPVLAPVTA